MANASKPSLVVLHAVPGRVRLRVPGLEACVARLTERLRAEPRVRQLRCNPACESVVVEHRLATEEIVELVRQALRQRKARPHARASAQPTATSVALAAQAQDPAAADGPAPLRALGWAGASIALAALPPARALAQGALFVCGLPIWRRAWEVLRHEQRFNVDFLDGLALAMTLLRRHVGTGALMAALVHLGDWIRDRTARRSKRKLQQLLDFKQVHARRFVTGGVLETVSADRLVPGDRVRVAAGDVVPADGVVLEGLATVDQRHMTGESVPACVQAQETLFAGSSIVEGAVTLEVTAAGPNTQAARIAQLVANAPLGDTRIQNYAERFADRLVAPMLAVNVGLLAVTRNLDRFVSLAIVDYGTGIRVAAPTGVLAAMTRAAQEGIVIRSGRHVERLAGLRGMAFDKTGTLTHGRMAVRRVESFGRALTGERLVALAAAVESHVRHPVARALVLHARHQGDPELSCADAKYTLGLGVEGTVAGQRVHVGNERYLRKVGIAAGRAATFLRQSERAAETALLVAVDGSLAGAIRLADEIRPDAQVLVAGLRERGVRELALVTGDRRASAMRVADALGIRRVHAEVLPEEKAEIVSTLAAEIGCLAMAGDGVNDAAALARADIGISVFGGADIARNAADVVLVKDDLLQLLRAIDLSRETVDIVRQNFGIVAAANSVALGLSLPGNWISPLACTVLSNGSAMLAVLNAARPLLPSARP